MANDILFSGQISLSGLSNWQEIVEATPPEFTCTNEWSEYAMNLFYSGGSMKGWKFRTTDSIERARQAMYLQALLGDFRPAHEDKEAAAGWMLSQILTEVPK